MNHKPLPSNPDSGKDSKLVSRLKGESVGWSLEQKEAIRAVLKGYANMIANQVTVRHKRDVLDDFVDELEAITKGEEQ